MQIAAVSESSYPAYFYLQLILTNSVATHPKCSRVRDKVKISRALFSSVN